MQSLLGLQVLIFLIGKKIILYEYIKVINAIITGKEKQWKGKDYKKRRLKFAL